VKAAGVTVPFHNFFESFAPEKSPGYLRCRGLMPWLGDRSESCDEVLTHTLRNATNVCFPVVKSSINLGGIQEERLRGIVQILKDRARLLSISDDEQFVGFVRELCDRDLKSWD